MTLPADFDFETFSALGDPTEVDRLTSFDVALFDAPDDAPTSE